MKDQVRIDLIRINGDWIGIYLDGKLKAENHELKPSEILQCLGLDYDYRELYYDDGCLPEDIKDLKLDEMDRADDLSNRNE